MLRKILEKRSSPLRAAAVAEQSVSSLQEKYGEACPQTGDPLMSWPSDLMLPALSHICWSEDSSLLVAGIAEHVEITEGEGGLPMVVLKHSCGSKAEV